MTAISGSTRLTGIIGWPVEHSLSPAMHNAAFAASGLDMAYVALPVAPGALAAAVGGLAALGFVGVNVTIPHKTDVVAFLDELADDAARIRAVNTIVVRDGRLLGHNTDVGGFERALREIVPEGIEGGEALLLGAGGAARAVALGLLRQGVQRLVVADRTPARAHELLALAGGEEGVEGRVVALDALTPADVAGADVLVNATSLGMSAELKVPGVLVDNIRRDHIVFDVVYGKRPTKPLARARAVGARAVDGLGMLAWQAALAFELWTGRPAPLDVMRSAAR
ncbi:MAG TPA: shikimate dehydrogenase [Thermoleophilia bacterium]|nr:shikimate dehydrogenase [Thermoleophilia bacterium]